MESCTVMLSNGDRHEVFVSGDNHSATLGETTLLTDVIINRLVLDKPSLLDYVVTHEFAHKRQWQGFIVAGLALSCHFTGLLVLLLGLFSLVWPTVLPQPLRLGSFGAYLLVASLMALNGIIGSWLVEYKADVETIHLLGMEKVAAALRERQSLPALTREQKLVHLFTHPPVGLTLATYRLFHTTSPSKAKTSRR